MIGVLSAATTGPPVKNPAIIQQKQILMMSAFQSPDRLPVIDPLSHVLDHFAACGHRFPSVHAKAADAGFSYSQLEACITTINPGELFAPGGHATLILRKVATLGKSRSWKPQRAQIV
jgi:hypothetical protein